MSFGYGSQRQTYPNSINGGTTVRVRLWHYPGVCVPTEEVDREVEEDSSTGHSRLSADADSLLTIVE